MEKLRQLIPDVLGSKERLTRVELQKASALVFQMNHEADILADLSPQFDTRTKKYVLNEPTLYASSTCWLAKSGDAVSAPYQIAPLGGGFEPEIDMSLEGTLLRELEEEGHVNGVLPGNCHKFTLTGDNSTRRYSFTHDRFPGVLGGRKNGKTRVIYDEAFYSVEIAPYPFLVPKSLDPQTHAFRPLPRLNITQLQHLFENDYIELPEFGRQQFSLLDSLSSARYRRRRPDLETDGQEIAIREEMLRRSLAYEVQLRVEIIDRLLTITSSGDKKRLALEWKKVNKRHHSLMQQGTWSVQLVALNATDQFLAYFENSLKALPDETMSQFFSGEAIESFSNPGDHDKPVRLRKRAHLILELRQAVRHVFFQRSLQAIENSGPQKPFLLSQIIQQTGRFTDYEYFLIEKSCPEVKDVFDTVAEVFSIEITGNPEWYEQIKAALSNYRNLKIEYDSHAGIAVDFDMQQRFAYYKEHRNMFSGIHAQKMGTTTDGIPLLANDVNNFLNYVERSISKWADRSILKRLFQDPHHVGTSAIDELFLVMFGLDQYDEINDSHITSGMQSAAFTKILLIKTAKEVNDLWKNFLQRYTYSFRRIFDGMFVSEAKAEVSELAPEYSLYQYRTNFSLDSYELHLPFWPNPISIDLSDVPLNFFAGIRDKDKYSLWRKHIERGIGDISDFFGRIIIIDTESLYSAVAKAFINIPELHRLPIIHEYIQSVTCNIARKGIVWIMKTFKEELESKGYDYKADRVRVTGLLKPSDSWRGPFAEAGIQLEDPPHIGSAAAVRDLFTWVKYVQSIRSGTDEQYLPEELQIFFSVDDLRKKKVDDVTRFEILRLFISHHPGYFSLLFSLFGIQETYEEVAEKQYMSGT